MSTRAKRLAAIRNNPRQVRFADLKMALEGPGFTARTGKGDHWVFEHELLDYGFTVDPRRPDVLAVYVREALEAVDEVLDKRRGRDW